MNKNALSAAIASAGIMILMVAASIYFKPKQLDENGCEITPPGKMVVLIDTSDDVTAQTKKEIIVRVKAAIENKVKDGELVTVFTINEFSKKNLSPLFAYCKPKRSGNELTENNRQLERTYVKKFEKPLTEAVNSQTHTSKQSPIAQSLIDLSLSNFLRSEKKATLLIFSDLMEHTEKFSLYGCTSGTKAVNSFRESRGASAVRPKFHNLDIELNIIPRPENSAINGRCRDHFWIWFLGDNTGAEASINPLDMPG